MNTSRHHRGFTLVELLVCLTIVALLIAIVLPSILSIRYSAKVSWCADNLRHIATSLNGYAAMNGGNYPPNTTFMAPGQFWFDRQRAGSHLDSSSRSRPGKPGGGTLTCPNDEEAARSYSMNIWASSSVDSNIFAINPAGFWNASVKHGSRMILITESWSYLGSVSTGFYSQFAIGNNGPTAARRFGASGGLVPYYAGRWGWLNCDLAYERHRGRYDGGKATQAVGRINIAYADGHVSLKSNDDLVFPLSNVSSGDSQWYPNEIP